MTLNDGTVEAGIVHSIEVHTGSEYVYVKPLSNVKASKFFKVKENIAAQAGVQYTINDYYYGKDHFRCDAMTGTVVTCSYLTRFPINCVRSDPTWIKQLIRSNRNLDLPCFLNYRLFTKILREMIDEQWSPLCHNLVDRSVVMVTSLVQYCIRSVKLTRCPLLLAFIEDQISPQAAEFI